MDEALIAQVLSYAAVAGRIEDPKDADSRGRLKHQKLSFIAGKQKLTH